MQCVRVWVCWLFAVLQDRLAGPAVGGPSAGRRDVEFGVLSFPLGHHGIYTPFMAIMIQIFFKAPSRYMDLKF